MPDRSSIQSKDSYFYRLLVNSGYVISGGQIAIRGEYCGKIGLEHSGDVWPAEFKQTAERIFLANKQCNIVVLSSKKYTSTIAETGIRLTALLDDFAQLIGNSLECVETLQDVKGRRCQRQALFVRSKGCICCAETMYDAHALAMVVEKACAAYIGSSFLGGGKRIPAHEAWLMRRIYLMSYSKKQKIKAK